PNCKICNSENVLFDSAKILNKYEIQYYKCPNCGFIQTEEPYWLDEAYSSAITSSDIGLINRNIEFSQKLNTLLKIAFPNKQSFLDYGGGYGIFVRLMRDNGYDFEWYDEYCENLFAKGHEKTKQHYDILTTFEMFEHIANPMELIEKLVSLSDSIIFSTVLLPENTPKVKDWWYFCTDYGQHISFYTKKALEFIAKKYSLNYFFCLGFHIFTKEVINIRRIEFLMKHKKLINYFYHNRVSLLTSDYEKITGIELK
ncbi:MAG: class I SAM-dependent methyltransferase, partial [Treponema sp.]|nr:class I SAM-dependent methyltransferase [Treponema sp.]